MLACQQSSSIWRRDLFNNDDGGASEAISSNSQQWQDSNGKTVQQPSQQLWQDSDIGASAISFNLAAGHP
jgi:hypothetical protein